MDDSAPSVRRWNHGSAVRINEALTDGDWRYGPKSARIVLTLIASPFDPTRHWHAVVLLSQAVHQY
ncbi:hypothetical protein ACE10Z_17295 [Bradyrhizobium sp. Pha-3]|uniref:hypothetical protein n=1 Tax=Bradyrhizobium sp. Pha-3 TaxID=208375 RepID=UPI0035D460EE